MFTLQHNALFMPWSFSPMTKGPPWISGINGSAESVNEENNLRLICKANRILIEGSLNKRLAVIFFHSTLFPFDQFSLVRRAEYTRSIILVGLYVFRCVGKAHTIMYVTILYLNAPWQRTVKESSFIRLNETVQFRIDIAC